MGLKTEKIGSQKWKLLEDVQVSSLGYCINVQEGFVSDMASIPKLFWNLIGSPFTGRYTEAALVHDALYASEALPRKEADGVFLELMAQAGVSYWKRYSMYWAVRLGGGGLVWKKHKPEDVNIARMYIDVKKFTW